MTFQPGIQQLAAARLITLGNRLASHRLWIGADPLGGLAIALFVHQLASPSPISRPRCKVSMRCRMRAISARS